MLNLMILLTSLLVFSGCSALKGTMLDGQACVIASVAQEEQFKEQVINSYVSDKSKDKARMYATAAGLTATAWCEMARARDAAKAQKVNMEISD